MTLTSALLTFFTVCLSATAIFSGGLGTGMVIEKDECGDAVIVDVNSVVESIGYDNELMDLSVCLIHDGFGIASYGEERYCSDACDLKLYNRHKAVGRHYDVADDDDTDDTGRRLQGRIAIRLITTVGVKTVARGAKAGLKAATLRNVNQLTKQGKHIYNVFGTVAVKINNDISTSCNKPCGCNGRCSCKEQCFCTGYVCG